VNGLRALLPFVLGTIAGSTDTIGFLGLNGLFTAHITGNLVILAAHLIAGDSALLSQILAVPVFALASLLAALFARRLEAKGSQTLRPLLSLELTLLTAFLVVAVCCPTRFDCDSPLSVAIGMCGVSAMAVQGVLVKSAMTAHAHQRSRRRRQPDLQLGARRAACPPAPSGQSIEVPRLQRS
jgi:uncharacterized membrane protein YoaK (UPF0700 family)